jgi:glycosyltransferase involved in cell wall biosynthesis
VPVVAYSSGSLPEVIGDCGVVVEEGDRASLAAGLAGLAAEPSRRRAAGDCGRARARERYRIERAAAEMCERYAALAAGR